MEELGQVRRVVTQARLSEAKGAPPLRNVCFSSRVSAICHTRTAVITGTVSTEVLEIEFEVFLPPCRLCWADFKQHWCRLSVCPAHADVKLSETHRRIRLALRGNWRCSRTAALSDRRRETWRCRAPPAAGHTLGSTGSRPALGRPRVGTEGQRWGTDRGCYTPGTRPDGSHTHTHTHSSKLQQNQAKIKNK